MFNKYIKILLPLLFIFAATMGIIQGNTDPYLKPTKKISALPSTNNTLRDYYNKSKAIAEQKINDTATTTFLAVGDIMLSRNVAAEIKAANDPSLPFYPLTPLFQSVNFSFGNLESPFAEKNPIIGGNSLIFGAPSTSAQSLADYNFKILNLANNHALDMGIKGLNYTKNLLSDPNIGIEHSGVGLNLDEAWRPAILERNGIKICFIGASYASINDNGKTENNYVARIEDIDRLKNSILIAKSECDFTVVTMHAGTEYTRTPNDAQIKFAHAAIDFGADVVIGAHPHWVQTIEKYCPAAGDLNINSDIPYNPSRCKYIFYSLGNFIFDQMWSQDTKEGLTLKMTISKQGNCHPGNPSAAEGYPGSSTEQKINSGSKAGMTTVGTCSDNLQGSRTPARLESIELIPIIIENYSTPRPATAEEAKKILKKISINESTIH